MVKTEITVANIGQHLVGKQVITMCTGMEVLGVVTAVKESQFGTELYVNFIEPKSVEWGNEHYTKNYPFLRSDGMWAARTWLAE